MLLFTYKKGGTMCEKCYRKGKKSKLPKGKIRYFAYQVLSYRSIPLFWKNADNCAIEGEVWKIMRYRTNKRIYNRKKKEVLC